jgi:hypothetical protein
MVENVSQIEEIASKIRRYLLEHPNAADPTREWFYEPSEFAIERWLRSHVA